MSLIRNLLAEPKIRDCPYSLDDPRRTQLHGELIRRKGLLNSLYRQWYRDLIRWAGTPEKVLELGSGAGFMKELYPSVITSDVLELSGVDKVADAMALPFEDKSLNAIVMIDVFHHIPKPLKFLQEAARVLKPGGRVVMTEPSARSWGTWIYRNFHHEPFEKDAGWELEGSGALSSANGALPYIFFERDLDKIAPKIKPLHLTIRYHHTPLRYLLSGGVSMRALCPGFMHSVLEAFEKGMTAVSGNFAMFQTIVLENQS